MIGRVPQFGGDLACPIVTNYLLSVPKHLNKNVNSPRFGPENVSNYRKEHYLNSIIQVFGIQTLNKKIVN